MLSVGALEDKFAGLFESKYKQIKQLHGTLFVEHSSMLSPDEMPPAFYRSTAAQKPQIFVSLAAVTDRLQMTTSLQRSTHGWFLMTLRLFRSPVCSVFFQLSLSILPLRKNQCNVIREHIYVVSSINTDAPIGLLCCTIISQH